jgi:excinuclease ABC subunit B
MQTIDKTFELVSDYSPSGDQPHAIDALVAGLNSGKKEQILLGVTGSGKTFTMANVIARMNRPALILAHNKTLAAQLCEEFRSFFPNNAVEYFISYYDFYQPEAYIPGRDVYIEKEAQINAEIERLRHAATRSLLTRRDVIIVASVSCIYGLGIPEDYARAIISLKVGETISRRDFLLRLDKVQYQRNDVELAPGRYRVKGDVIDLFPSWSEMALRMEFFGDELERILEFHPVSGNILNSMPAIDIFPATHYVVHDNMDRAMQAIKKEMTEQVAQFMSEEKLLEAQRLEQRTRYDLEMIAEMGYCKGIENYSRHLSDRQPGEPSGVLLDFFPKDFVTFVDESHASLPQVRGMFAGDLSRKTVLVDHGFRLPSAVDNRPLRFEEFEERLGSRIYVSATPGPYEMASCGVDMTKPPESRWEDTGVVEQIIRPTGLVDPEIEVRETVGQIDDLLNEIQIVRGRNERTLVTTITKQMSEELAQFLDDKGVLVTYLHSEIQTLDRLDILKKLRSGKIDVLVGVNLLREGLDLPEVSLVVILDADKEGFLRNERSLIQTIGRAARNVNGRVIMYADKMTPSMTAAISETTRRRTKQLAYNETHAITPKSTTRTGLSLREEKPEQKALKKRIESVSPEALPDLMQTLEKEMHAAAAVLDFERAAALRDQLQLLSGED